MGKGGETRGGGGGAGYFFAVDWDVLHRVSLTKWDDSHWWWCSGMKGCQRGWGSGGVGHP